MKLYSRPSLFVLLIVLSGAALPAQVSRAAHTLSVDERIAYRRTRHRGLATFTVNTMRVKRSTTVTISGSYGEWHAASLTVK